MGPQMKERTKLIIQSRIAGESYRGIAERLGIRIQTARTACLRAMWKGIVTPEQIRYGHNQPTLSDAEYDALWLARLVAKSRPAANGCIEVPGVFHNEDGYAIAHHRKLGQFAHHVIVIVKGREIPPGFMSCHRCGNHGCVNDDHLYVGTMKDNARDTVAMGRHLEKNKTECIHGHPFDEANTRVCKFGKRHCRACERASGKKPHIAAWRRRYQAKRRALKREQRQSAVVS